jgi:anti-anti-sigma factor
MTTMLGGAGSTEDMTAGSGNAFGPARAEAVDRSESMLTVTLRTVGSTCVLALAGELTATTVAALEAQIEQLALIAGRDVVLDLQRVEHLDDVGANVLTGFYHYARGRGQRMTMIGASSLIAERLDGTPLARDLDR